MPLAPKSYLEIGNVPVGLHTCEPKQAATAPRRLANAALGEVMHPRLLPATLDAGKFVTRVAYSLQDSNGGRRDGSPFAEVTVAGSPDLVKVSLRMNTSGGENETMHFMDDGRCRGEGFTLSGYQLTTPGELIGLPKDDSQLPAEYEWMTQHFKNVAGLSDKGLLIATGGSVSFETS